MTTPSNANTSGLEVVDLNGLLHQAWERLHRADADVPGALVVLNALHVALETPLVTSASAQAIIDRLKLAICGGEDVPGSIALVTVEDCERFCREAQAQHGDMIDRATATEARVAELEAAKWEAQHVDTMNDLVAMGLARDAAEARADRLAKFGQHINWELSFCYPDDEEGEPGCWAVHCVNGGRNDREWTLIGRGKTPDDAIRAALQQEPAT